MAGRRDADQQLARDAPAGSVCDLSQRDPDDRTVHASEIHRLCVGPAAEIHRRGLRVVGAVVEGELDLAYATLTAPLVLEGCTFTDAVVLNSVAAPALHLVECQLASPLLLNRAKITDDLDLHGTQLSGVDDNGLSLDAQGLEVGGDLLLDRDFTTAGAVRLDNSTVGGNLRLTGARLNGTDAGGVSLGATRLRVDGSAHIDGGFHSTGAVFLGRAEIGNFLDMADARIDGVSEWGASLSCGRARFGGSVYLRPGLVTAGAVRLTLASIGGKLHMRGARLNGADRIGAALSAASLQVAGDVSLPEMRTAAAIVLERANIGGRLDLRDVSIGGGNGDGYSLEASGVHVVGHAFLSRGFTTTGAVRLRGSRFDGGLTMVGASFGGADAEGVALRASAVRIAGGSYLSEGFEAAGSVRFRNSTFEGGLFMVAAKVTGADIGGRALDLRGARLEGDLYLGRGFEAEGAVELRDAVIEGELRITDARLLGVDDDGNSLNASGVHIVGDARLSWGFEAVGAIRLRNAVIDGTLGLEGARILGANARGASLLVNGARVGGNAYLSRGLDVAGGVSLRNAVVDGRLDLRGARLAGWLNMTGARCAELVDDEASWPKAGELILRGFRFGVLAGESGWRRQTEWVRRQGFEDWSPDPYEQLATYYVSVGDEEAAHRIRMTKSWDELSHLKVSKATGRWAYRLWRRPFGWFLGFGYRRWPAALLLALTVLGAGLVFRLAEHDAAMVPSDPVEDSAGPPPECGATYSCFNSWVYGADVVLPIVDFGQDSTWRPVDSRWWVWSRWALIAAGWVLASVFVAAFTGLVQRD